MSENKVLVTGGAGYIGSHTLVELIASGYEPIVIDVLLNSSAECLKRVEKITGKTIELHTANLLSQSELDAVFLKHKFACVIHFAALKAVGESTQIPLKYYENNLGSTIALLKTMQKHNVKNFVFSSSATVYGETKYLPLDEKHPTGVGITNTYGRTKHFIEHMLIDLYNSDKSWNIVILRYFNPTGAHASGLIGEDPCGPPNNLMPYMSQVAVGKREFLSVFGNDYDTVDGTGVRDYIHVVDLAKGHVSSLNLLNKSCGLKIYNLGTGHGYSVLEMVKALEKASGNKIAYKIMDRRAGDLACIYADCSLAKAEMGWEATRDLDEMCVDLWRWQSNNPNGFADKK